MAAIKSSIKDILCLENIPVVLQKSYEMEAFVMGHHLYNVAIFQEGKKKIIGHLPLEKSVNLAKTSFSF